MTVPSGYQLDENIIDQKGIPSQPSLSIAGFSRLYFDGTEFLVSQNGAAYVPLSSNYLSYRAITALRTLDATDNVVDCTANTFTVTLPTAVGITGRRYIIKNSGTGVITVAAGGAETIDGEPTYVLAVQYGVVTVLSNGTDWIQL